jgi:hypothetical protein
MRAQLVATRADLRDIYRFTTSAFFNSNLSRFGMTRHNMDSQISDGTVFMHQYSNSPAAVFSNTKENAHAKQFAKSKVDRFRIYSS